MTNPVHLPTLITNGFRYHATKLEIRENLELMSTAKMTVPENEAPHMHALIELYTADGSVGIYRVTSIQRTYYDAVEVEMAHAIDTLSDWVIAEKTEFSGSVAALLAKVMGAQKQASGVVGKWQLGTCEDPNTEYDYDIEYSSAYDVLEQIAQDEIDYYFTFDFSTSPWTVNFRHRPTNVLSRFCIERNVVQCEVTQDDSELCTRLYIGLTNPNVGSHNYYTYDSLEGQQTYGIIERVVEMEATSRAPANRFAARYLQEHAARIYNVVIDGADLYHLTGVPVDRMILGAQCNVVLPPSLGYIMQNREVITQPIVSIEHPDALNLPTSVKVTLSKKIITSSEQYREQKKQLDKLERLQVIG